MFNGKYSYIYLCLLIWKQTINFAFEVKYNGSKNNKSHIE